MKTFGLGDIAYYLFRPVVYVIDGIWGTDLRNCDVCKARRKRWNKLGEAPLWPTLLLVTLLWAYISWGK